VQNLELARQAELNWTGSLGSMDGDEKVTGRAWEQGSCYNSYLELLLGEKSHGGDAISDPCACFVSGDDPELDRDMAGAAHRTMPPVDSLAATIELERVFLSGKL